MRLSNTLTSTEMTNWTLMNGDRTSKRTQITSFSSVESHVIFPSDQLISVFFSIVIHLFLKVLNLSL